MIMLGRLLEARAKAGTGEPVQALLSLRAGGAARVDRDGAERSRSGGSPSVLECQLGRRYPATGPTLSMFPIRTKSPVCGACTTVSLPT